MAFTISPPGRVDQHGAVFHQCQFALTDDVARVQAARQVNRKNVTTTQQLVQIDKLHTDARLDAQLRLRVERNHSHTKAAGNAHDLLTYFPRTNDAQYFPREVKSPQIRNGKVSTARLRDGLRKMATEGQQQCERVFGDSMRSLFRYIAHHDSGCPARDEIDVVIARRTRGEHSKMFELA